ncbi:hypothetical protein YC2023_012873 [Brassica napus]
MHMLLTSVLQARSKVNLTQAGINFTAITLEVKSMTKAMHISGMILRELYGVVVRSKPHPPGEELFGEEKKTVR